ncbi:MAG: phosphoribosyl-AMP cyclohydrolase [Microbacteriaceae bacterium]|nr:phosphoribosyl-AMP cyclohydrolase [Microbacteriaceae bacterium]
MVNIDGVNFGPDGLVVAVVQQHDTRDVLMVAYMNAEALRRTLAEGLVTYWSRSRNEFWRKGDTSGNSQRLVSITADCDGDALLVVVDQNGPACHTGSASCFTPQGQVTS